MEEEASRTGRFMAAREKIPAAVTLIERARDLLNEVEEALPDPSGKVERQRDLDFELDVDPDETVVVARCVVQDYLRPAIDDLRDLTKAEEEEVA